MIHAHWAVYHRTANERVGYWPDAVFIDSGIRGETEAQALAQWNERPASARDWQEVSLRLVPIEDKGTLIATIDDDDDIPALETA